MKEIEDIVRAYDDAAKAGKKTALATVVHVEGSSYRRPGARMLITEDGLLTGAISGGCLEGDALRKALMVIMQQQAMLVTYDTSDEEDAVIGMGLGCNGIIQVLIEPVDEANIHHPIALLKNLIAKRQDAALVTLFALSHKKEAQPGTCILVANNESICSQVNLPGDILMQVAHEAIAKQQSFFNNYSKGDKLYTAFTQFIPPAISLIIVGAGNDVKPLADMAMVLGWKITIADGRPAYAKKERFPAGCQVLLAKPEQIIEQLVLDNRTAVALMTHNYIYDLSLLRLLLQKPVKYIGMLGPKKKLQRMLEKMKQEGNEPTNEKQLIIHSPVGLDIGAETAEEIALSILAEVQAIFTVSKGSPLTDNIEPIHQRSGPIAISHL